MSEHEAPQPSAGPKRTRWFAAAALAVAAIGFLVIAYGQIGENLVYYWGPKELRAAGAKAVGATIRLGGMVVAGSVKGGQAGSELRFDVTDFETIVPVRSKGVPPQMFREGIGVVVEGTMTPAGFFESHRLMVSHNNEYRAPGDKHPGRDVKDLIQSTEGLSEGSD